MDIIYSFHPISLIGMALLGAGLLMILLLFFNHELVYGKIQLKGNLHRTKKWPTMQKTAVGFLVSGAIIFGCGFYFPRPSNNGPVLSWRIWRGNWDIEFYGETVPKNFRLATFDRIQAEGGILQAKVFDEENRECGSFQRLEPSAAPEDYRLIKGKLKVNSGKTIMLELALLGDKETFCGIAYDSKSVKRVVCWGRKR